MPHQHKCESCGHIWTHETPTGVSADVHRFAHCCPKCGKGPFFIRHEEQPFEARRGDLFKEAQELFDKFFRGL